LHKKIFVVTPIAPLKGEAEPTKNLNLVIGLHIPGFGLKLH
jgi:hypothetical protein